MTMTQEPTTTTTLSGEEKGERRRRSAPANTLERAGLMPDVVDALMAKAETEGLHLVGPDGVLAQLTKALIERAVAEELTDHLGYDHGDPAGRGSGNSRNGTTPKTIQAELGPVQLDLARDRNGTFEPQLIPKGSRRLAGFDDQIIALYAGGMTVRDIKRHLKRMYGADVSPELISRVTDGVVAELNEWQNRALDAVYPIVYIDALVIKVRHNGTVINKACYLALGVDVEGRKQILGLWLGDGDEGAKFWLGVLTELRSRGIADVIFVCCDGLKGLPDAIEATWPQAIVQTCVVHLLRNAFKFCSYKDRRAIAKALKPIYTALNEAEAADALDDFEIDWGDRYPGIVKLWRSNWERFAPFLAYPPEIRTIIYTTNAIESVNYQLRKVSKNRGHFPDDAAALKLLRLVARDISTTRGGIAGTGTTGWHQALNAFEIHFPGRLNLI